MAWTMELIPSPVAARPMASIITVLYFSPIPFFNVLPTTLPMSIVLVLAIVPIMVLLSPLSVFK